MIVAMSDVVVTDVPAEGRFEARTPDGELLGLAAYVVDAGRVVFTHTEVEPAAEGQGVGSALVRGALDDVRASGRRVVALCPFVKAYVARHAEYQDLLDHR
jgi:predicted GNAT family acetyltransferase